jgi:hypothetical protein
LLLINLEVPRGHYYKKPHKGSRHGRTQRTRYAEAARYNLVQYLRARTCVDGGAELSFDPDASNPGRPHGLFRLTAA